MHRQAWNPTRTLQALCILAAVGLTIGGLGPGCRRREPAPGDSNETAAAPTIERTGNASTDYNEIPRFAANSPFDVNFASPIPRKQKRLWAGSFLWERPPEFVVEKWLTDEPDTKGLFPFRDRSQNSGQGKYVLLEFWATWCSQSRRAVPLMNRLHSRFNKELVVIGISDEKEEVVRKFIEQKTDYYVAIDTQARMKDKLGVFGIPHVLIIEPGGYVVWEGFPFLKGYELTEEVVEKILSVGRESKAKAVAGQ